MSALLCHIFAYFWKTNIKYKYLKKFSPVYSLTGKQYILISNDFWWMSIRNWFCLADQLLHSSVTRMLQDFKLHKLQILLYRWQAFFKTEGILEKKLYINVYIYIIVLPVSAFWELHILNFHEQQCTLDSKKNGDWHVS